MCLDHIADTIRFSDEEAQDVYDDFLCEAVKDFSVQAEKGEPLSYTFEEQKKRFERVFQYHREENLDFQIQMKSYKKEFLNLVCIKQLIKVKDFAANEIDKVAKYASYFYSFYIHSNWRYMEYCMCMRSFGCWSNAVWSF